MSRHTSRHVHIDLLTYGPHGQPTLPLLLLLPILLATVLLRSAAVLCEHNAAFSSSPVRPYSFLSEDITGGFGGNFALPYRNHFGPSEDSSSYSSLTPDDSADLYSGPVFTIEPEQSDRLPLLYSNVTSVPLNCKVYGYPTPRIEWRVDNISLTFAAGAHDEHSRQQIYSPQLNAFVRLRNDGQTLIIGGSEANESTYSSTYHRHHPFSSPSSQLHQIECLATNQFGAIISRPVYVQQGASNSETGLPFGSSLPSGGHQFSPYGPKSSPPPSISVQLYDEFVSRGNVAVLKCLVLNVASSVGPSGALGTANGPISAKLRSAATSSSSQTYPSSAYHYHRMSSPVGSSSSAHHFASSTAEWVDSVAAEFVFEWRIKNGPAASASTGETILTLRSNQTQGKYTAYPTGELHVRDVDEHDARRTYQCVIYPRGRLGPSTLSAPFAPFTAASGYGRKYGSPSELHHGHLHAAMQLPIESTFAQIILSGSEKDVFPPRLVHRLGTGSTGSAEIFAENGQLDSILIPCAAQAQPLPSYRWFWIPLATGPVGFDLDAELSSLSMLQTSSSNAGPTLPHPLAIAIPPQTSGGSSNPISDPLHRRHQMSLSRMRTFGGGSTLQIPGPISAIDSGHYVALVANTIGYERCTTSLFVRSPLSIRLEWSSASSSGSSSTASSTSSPLSSGKSTAAAAASSGRSRPVIRALRGERIQLRCLVNGFPVSELYWLHNALPLAALPGDSTTSGGGSSDGSSLPQQSDGPSAASGSAVASGSSRVELLLDEQHKGGMYQCFARNRFQVVQTSVEVAVIDQEPSLVEKFSELTVQPGDFVTLRCTSLASPLAQIHWSIDGQAVPNSARYRFGDFVVGSPGGAKSSGQSSRLVSHFNITSVRVEDGGLYRCTAKNIAGTVFHQARLNVYGKASVKLHSPNMTALSNSDIELNCPFYGYPLKSITWFSRDGSSRKLPINGRQHISSNGTLHISKVSKKEDQGSYECEVQQDSGLIAKAKIHLKVITGPRIDNFTFASNLEEGMRSVAICAVIAGDSPIRISWLKDGLQLLSHVASDSTSTLDYKIEMVNEFTSSITFTALKRRHAGRYTCIASNPASSDQHSADLKVNVAPVWVMEPKDIVAISGQRMIIDCQAEGIPEPQIRWKMESFEQSSSIGSADSNSISERLFSGKKKSNSGGSSGSNSNTFHAVISNPHIQILENGSLFIKEVTRDDHRRYMCSAFNGVGSGISTIIRLAVNFPPQFIYGYYESKSIKVGESIVLTCLVKVEHIEPVMKNSSLAQSAGGNSNSLAMEMRWYKMDGKASPINPPHSDAERHSSLPHDRYHITSTFELTDPGAMLYNATTAQSSLPANDHTLYYVTKLTIRQVERSDSGSYLCTAQNHYGFIRKNFTIIALEVPDKPPEVRTDTVTSTSMKISWLAPYDGNSAISEYVISYRALTATVPVTVSVSAFYSTADSASGLMGPKKWITYQLSELVPFTAYSIQIKAKNAIGYSSFSDAITVKTAEEPPSEVPTDVTILPLNTRSLKISWRRPRYSSMSKNVKSKGGYIPPITGYYIGYRPNLDQASEQQQAGSKVDPDNNEFVFKTVKAAGSVSDSDSETFVLNNLKRATRYDIKIQAFNLAGAGPSTSELLGKTLDFDVPNAPRIRALKSNLSSIELVWSVQGEEPIAGFVIAYKPASANELSSSASGEVSLVSPHDEPPSDEWKAIKLEVDSDEENVSGVDSKANNGAEFYGEKRVVYEGSTVFHRRTYVLGSLRCGTKYFIYVNAYNQVGQGDPSEVILSRTEGNVPIAPESVQEFLSSNVTYVRLNLNQWKKLGCPIELFEIEYRLYGDSSSAQKVTYRPELTSTGDHARYVQHYQLAKKDDAAVENETNFTSLFNYEIFNLTPGSWYELIVRAQTEAGHTSREFYFATLKVDGSTVAPLTLKATDGSSSGRDSSGSFLSISSSRLAQLHYIVPVSCALFILFLVTVVVCAIHTNHQQRQLHPQDHPHFLLSFMTTRNRSDKVTGGKTICSNSSTSGHYTSSSGGTTTAGSCAGDHPGSLMMMLHDSTGNPLTDLQGDFCTGKLDEQRYGKPMGNGVGHRSDSCHSLGGCGPHHEMVGQPVTMHMETLKMSRTSGCDNGSGAPPPLPPTSKSNSAFPLYNLPVPYATSAVGGKGGGQDIYGTSGPCHYNKGQLSEMYCDNTQGSVSLVMLEQSNTAAATYSQRPQQMMDSNGELQSGGGGGHHLHRGSTSGGHHQYELPFVFKNIPNNHNESTAF